MKEEIRKAERINCVALGIVLVFAVLTLCGILGFRYAHSFTPKKWAEAPNRRIRIVDDLLSDYALAGLSEAEVMALLGENDNQTGYFSAPDRYVYCLGPERGVISIDNEWLILEFNGGVVSEYYLTTD